MKQYIDKSAVVAEIEKRLHANGAFDEFGDEAWAEDVGMCNAYKSILSFLDTLEVKEVGVDFGDPQGDIGVKWVQEEPVSNNLKEAADNYVGHAPEIDEDLSCFTKRNAFIAGAQWQKERILNVATEREVKVDVGGYPYIDFTELYDFDKDIPLAKEGDKVKLVIVKNLNG